MRDTTSPVAPESELIVYGEPDDHLRLTVLLADRIGRRGDRTDPDAVALCMAPSTAWPRRLDALDTLLTCAKELPLRIADIDALYQGRTIPHRDRWRDATFKRERAALFETLLLKAPGTAWRFARTAPDPEVTLRLSDAGLETSAPAAERLLLHLSPEVRPVAQWLIDQRVLRPFDLEELIQVALDDGDSPDDDLLAILDDVLPPAAEQAAHALSALRPPQRLNGVIGPYGLVAGAPEHGPTGDTFPRSAIELLLQAGLLVPASGSTEPTRVRMPGRIRRFFQRRARVTVHDPASLHARLDRYCSEEPTHTIEAAIEAHHHAILSGDLERATRSATYCISDLRQLAYQRSHDAAALEGYLAAATIYASIVEVDPSDAYAWEYLGYNLARAHRDHDLTDDTEARIAAAYQRAAALEPGNPLFAGRLLGFRAQRGEAIEGPPEHALRRFLPFGAIAIGYFAKPVLDGLKRARRLQERAALIATWRTILTASDELKRLLDLVGSP